APERRRVRRARPDARAPPVDRRRTRPGLRPSRGGGGRPRARSARRAGGPDRPRGSARELGRARMVLGPPRGDRGGAEECARLRRATPRGARRVLGRGATREGLGGWPRAGRERAPACVERRRAAPGRAARLRLWPPLALGQRATVAGAASRSSAIVASS